ncbi:hypothetical protein GWK47_024794 [Chionoecetes opilio]|uniref:Uncharacterized protein n=1 Tax=Chionoecetes opilio TaxID=41210 RepID=A0A8J4XKT8_CHIOP|nr:hypothetical protein GWK47_024794 [Chionoecetes opilio]
MKPMSSTRSTDKLWLVGAPATQELPSVFSRTVRSPVVFLQYQRKLNPRCIWLSQFGDGIHVHISTLRQYSTICRVISSRKYSVCAKSTKD